MPIREVATDRDVRAPRLLPSAAQLASVHSLRRAGSVVTLIAIDICSFVLAVVLVPPASGMGWITLWPGLSWGEVALASAVLVAVAAFKSLYGRRYVRHSMRKILSAWMIAFVITAGLMLVVDPEGIGARYVVAWVMASLLAVAARFVYDALVGLVYGAAGDAPPALLLGSLGSCLSALPTLATLEPQSRVRVVGLVVPGAEHKRIRDNAGAPPVVATIDGLQQALRTSGAAQVIIADPAAINGQLQSVIDACRTSGVALKLVSLDLHLHADADAVSYIPGMDCPLFVVRPRPAGAGSYLVKQAADRVGSAVLLVLLSPLLLVIAAAIKLTSRGPVLFADARVGVGQRPFRFYKFRTMVADAARGQGALEESNEAGDVLFKVHDDPRITRVGHALRRLSLDELPQLFNVLKGDMSLVGPRPLPLRDCELMEEWQRRRHVMLPGITGLWQVSGRSDLSFDDMVRLDLQYMETWSLGSDLHIMWRTAGAVVRSRGAY
jgi:exopolysaccharide biosynthesis polyprenyl glycosylphosphotransferase